MKQNVNISGLKMWPFQKQIWNCLLTKVGLYLTRGEGPIIIFMELINTDFDC